MNEHDRATTGSPQELPVLDPGKVVRAGKRPALVLDLSGCTELDVLDLSLLLTAQRYAQEEDRDVWLAGVSYGVWRKLHEMGLGGIFRPFPVSGRVAV